ncbi:hypothetical protein AB0C87_24935 [Actinomadura sp. NPDC048021]|uniref:hypothetical protein n=1 Tax=Actinomadura sp. NPDC048021 TaxID=3155385 RepID=UPI00340126DF
MADFSETERFYPFSEGPGEFVTEEDWAVMAEGFQDDGVYGHPGTSDLTIEPGPEPGTIRVNIGDAQLGGYHYRLTAPRLIDTVANANTVARADLVVLQLDRTARTITPTLLPGTSLAEIGADRCPIGLWTQPPASQVTAENWGTAADARWFIGARVRPFIPAAVPPAVPGGIIHNPREEGTGSVYLGKLDDNGQPYWAQWYPIASERMESFEVISRSDQSTSSTSWQVGSVAVSSTFVAPPSGNIAVTVFTQSEAESPAYSSMSFEIRENNATGAVFLAASDEWAAGSQDQYWAGSSRRKLVVGLTPGATYFIRTMHRSSTSGRTASFFFRSLLVEPVYTEVAPGTPPEGGLGVDPSTVVLTAGGSTIRVPDGNTATQAMSIRIPAGDRSTAPDTFGVYYNTGSDVAPNWQRTGYFNEYGEFRVIPSAPSRTPLRIKGVSGQTANLFEATDLDNVALAGVKPTGEVFAPNVGNAKVSAGPEPSGSRPGDIWVDLTQSPPVVNVRVSGGWSPITGGSVDPDPPAAAPGYVDMQKAYFNDVAASVPLPAGETIVACLAWNTAEAPSVPLGWTMVDEIVGSNQSRAAVYTAPAGVGSTTFGWTATTKISVVALGYSASVVTAHDKLSETAADTSHTAPALNVTTVPATLVRFYWDKVSSPTSFTADDTAASTRGVQLGTGGGAPSVLATDQGVTSAGTVPAANATTGGASGQAGGFSLALKAA